MSERCRWCGGPDHGYSCPRVRALDFDGEQLRRVEFRVPAPEGRDPPRDIEAGPGRPRELAALREALAADRDMRRDLIKRAAQVAPPAQAPGGGEVPGGRVLYLGAESGKLKFVPDDGGFPPGLVPGRYYHLAPEPGPGG